MADAASVHVIGIDLGGTNIKAAAVTKEGAIAAKLERPTEANQGVDHVIDRIQAMARQVAADAGWPWENVSGVGIGLPGFLNFQSGIVESLVNLKWSHVPILEVLEKQLGVPVKFDNDANCAALGEAWVGSGQGFKDMVAVTIGTGIGGGIILNGQIYRGVNGMAGEIGHLVMQPERGYHCNCGKTGCLETISSATAILRNAKKALSDNLHTALAQVAKETLTARDVVDIARSGDPVAFQVLKEAMETLGFALAYIGNTLNPQRIVIGGGVSKGGRILFELIQAGFEKGALPRVVEACEIVPAVLGNDAGVMGAAKLVL